MSDKMFETATKNEKTNNYVLMLQHGFHRPTKKERDLIRTAFDKISVTIYGVGYDLIDKKTHDNINNLDKIINEINLYELKTHGKDTKYKIDEEFNGFSFGITLNEIKNSCSLGSKFKIIYLNSKTNKIKIQNFKEIEKEFSHASYFFRVGCKPKVFSLTGVV